MTWMFEFLERIKSEIIQLSQMTLDDIFKYYSNYCIDMMQQALNLCVEHHREKIIVVDAR